jgi:hypothetical protein
MKGVFLLLAAVLLLTACSHLPEMQPADDLAAGKIRQICQDAFPKANWQFVHSIEAVMPGGKSAFLTGVAIIFPAERSFRCLILTLEGLALFDAEWERKLTVHRAISPFDSKPFAEGLAGDIRLLFLRPPESPIESGFLENGASLCRYRDSDGGIVEVVSGGNGNRLIRRYTHDYRLIRTVNMVPGENTGHDGIARKIELTAHGPQSYRLIMHLLEAVPIKE